jgi:hypothetical protein
MRMSVTEGVERERGRGRKRKVRAKATDEEEQRGYTFLSHNRQIKI